MTTRASLEHRMCESSELPRDKSLIAACLHFTMCSQLWTQNRDIAICVRDAALRIVTSQRVSPGLDLTS
eukprot:10048303-Alexandrium_andersonii.AAC.1